MKKTLACTLAALAGICLLATTLPAEEQLPNMMADAKVGDWVLLEVQGGIQMKQTVEAVTPEQLTLKIETIMNGQVISAMSQPINRTQGEYAEMPAAAADVPKPKISKGKATVKGQELDCWIIEMTVQGQTSKTYFSKEVPINGMVKTEMNGQASMKLVDFGRK
jgi:hypothetical protein